MPYEACTRRQTQPTTAYQLEKIFIIIASVIYLSFFLLFLVLVSCLFFSLGQWRAAEMRLVT